MISWFVHNPVASNLLMLFMLISGLASVNNLSLQSKPDKPKEYVSMSISVEEGSALEAENNFALPVEEAVKNISGIKSISVQSTKDSVGFQFRLDNRFSPDKTITNIEEKVEGIHELNQLKPGSVNFFSSGFSESVLTVVVSTDLQMRELASYVKELKTKLVRLEGVSSINVTGVVEPVIKINARYDWIKHYGLSEEVIKTSLASIQDQAISIGSGTDIITTEDIDLLNEVIIHSYDDGRFITLGDVADIKVRPPDSANYVRFNGRQSALIHLIRSREGNALDITNSASELLDKHRLSTDPSFSINVINDKSRSLEERVGYLVNNAFFGAVILFLILFLFLHVKIAFWVFFGIIIAFTSAIAVMNLLNISINSFSLFGFIVALGLVVDDAIVTAESVYYEMRPSAGLDKVSATIKGAQKVSVPVTFSMLTTIVAMLPLMFIESSFQHFFYQIPIVVIPILVLSLIESKLILPGHLKNMNVNKSEDRKSKSKISIAPIKKIVLSGLDRIIKKYYPNTLSWILKHRYVVLILINGICLIIYSLLLTGWIKFSYFQDDTDANISASLSLSTYSDAQPELIREGLHILESAAFKLKSDYSDRFGVEIIENVVSEFSQGYASVELTLVPREQYWKHVSIPSVQSDWQSLMTGLPDSLILTVSSKQGGFSQKSKSESDFSSLLIFVDSKDRYDINKVKTEVIKYLGSNPSLTIDTTNNYSDLLEFILTPFANVLGFTKSDIRSQLNEFLEPNNDITIQFGDKEVYGSIEFIGRDKVDKTDLARFELKATNGQYYPLSSLISWTKVKESGYLERRNLVGTERIVANYDINSLDPYQLEKTVQEYLLTLQSQNHNVNISLDGLTSEVSKALKSTLLLTILAMLIIYILLAVPLNSYFQPLAIIITLPFCYLGALIGHFLLGIEFGIMSVLGVVAALGVAVNDSMIYVYELNYIKTLGSKGDESDESDDRDGSSKDGSSKNSLLSNSVTATQLVRAGQARFNVVFLTSVSTFGSLTPLIFTNSVEGKLLVPMAISLGFGILFASLITLYLLPITFMVVNDFKRLIRACIY